MADCSGLITNEDLQNAKIDAASSSEFVSSGNPTLTTRLGSVKKTVQGMNDDADSQLSVNQSTFDNQTATNQSTFDTQLSNNQAAADNLIYVAGYQNVGVFGVGVTVQSAQETLTYNGEEFNTTAGPFPYTTTGATPTLDSADWYNVTLEARKTVARCFNVLDSDVTYDTPGEIVAKYIYSASQQKTYSVPADAIGKTISSVVGSELNTVESGGPYVLESTERNISVYVKDFGATPGGLVDSTAAIQAAIDKANVLRVQYTGTELGSATYGTTVVKVVFEATSYLVLGSLNAYQYPNFESAGVTILLGAAIGDADGSHYIIDNRATGDGGLGVGCYKSRFKGFLVAKCKGFIAADNNNLDQGNMYLEDIELKGLPDAFNLTLTSSKVQGENVKWDKCIKAATINGCDKITFNGGWLKEGVLTDDYSGTFVSNGALTLNDVLYVPNPQTVLHPALVAVMGGSCKITNTRLGGESGSHSIIANYAEGNTLDKLVALEIDDSSVFSASDITIVLFKLPNLIKVDGTHGYTNNQFLLAFNEHLVTLDSEIVRLGKSLQITVQASEGNGIDRDDYDKLAAYVQDWSGTTSYGVAIDASISNPVDLMFLGNENNIDSYRVRNNRAYIIHLQTSTSSGNTYSQYVVKSDFSGSSASLQEISLGATTSAPRLIIDSDVVKIVANSTATIKVYYRIDKVSAWFQ